MAGVCMAWCVCVAWGHVWWGGGHAWQGACMAGGCVAGETAIAAGGTHPTGMHTCYQCENFSIILVPVPLV